MINHNSQLFVIKNVRDYNESEEKEAKDLCGKQGNCRMEYLCRWKGSAFFRYRGKLVNALRQVGFDYIFDTVFSADLTIMEEGSEFIERFENKGSYKWPMFTSCCPGWLRFVKARHPELIPNLSTAKSPQQMFGAMAKTYIAHNIGVDPRQQRVGYGHLESVLIIIVADLYPSRQFPAILHRQPRRTIIDAVPDDLHRYQEKAAPAVRKIQLRHIRCEGQQGTQYDEPYPESGRGPGDEQGNDSGRLYG